MGKRFNAETRIPEILEHYYQVIIKEGIQGLNSQLDAAQEYVNRRKGQSQGKNVQTAEHSNIVVGRLKVEVLNTTKEFKVCMFFEGLFVKVK